MRHLALILALIFPPTVLAAKGKVEIAVWAYDQFVPQSDYKLVVMDAEGKDVSHRFKEGKAKIPHGRYRAEIDAVGFDHYVREFTAYGPETQILALLELGSVADFAPNSPPTRLVGRITNSSVPLEQLWVRVLSAQEGDRSRSADDLKVQPDGGFSVELSTWTSDYWVLVLAMGVERDERSRKPARIMNAVWATAQAHRDTNLEIDLRAQ